MRLSRLAIGAFLVLASIWVIVQEQLAGASADAVINTQVVTVFSPINGILTEFDRQPGDVVAQGDPLGVVVDDQADSVRLEDLILQRDLAIIRQDRLTGMLDLLGQEAATQKGRTTAFSEAALQELRVWLTEAEERLRVMTQQMTDADAISLSRAREEYGRVKAMVTAAESGFFIADGYDDVTFSEQRALAITDEMRALNADLTATRQELAALARRIDLERIRVSRLATAALASPVEGVIWERRAASGVQVGRGDALLRIADCEHAFVTLSVTQPVYNRLTPGTTASFRFDGSGEAMTGIVTRLAGTGAASVYDSLAVAPSQRHLERADVVLQLPDLASNPQLRCAIGRTGRVFFEVRPLDWLRAYFR